MAGTVLVLTRPDDLTADLIVLELDRRGTPVFRTDVAEFPQHLTLSAELGGGWNGSLRSARRVVRLNDITAVYYRRPSTFRLATGMTPVEHAWADTEARHGFGGVLTGLGCLWLPDPLAAARAEYKPLQLAAAERAGLTIPPTLITNDPAEAHTFVASQAGEVVYKPLYGRPILEGGHTHALSATPLTAEQAGSDAIRHTAHLFQARVPKAYDVRLTVVADRMFAARINAGSEAARLDWRADYDALTFTVIDPPPDIASGMLALLNDLGLQYAAADFVVDHRDTWWFIGDLNPNGQWAFIPDLRDPITQAIADLLEGT